MDFIQNRTRDVNVPAGVFLRELFATFKKGGLDKTACVGGRSSCHVRLSDLISQAPPRAQ